MSEPLCPELLRKWLGKPPQLQPAPAPVVVPRPLPPPPLCEVKRIANIVAAVWDIPVEAMPSPRRARMWSWPRMAAMDLCRKLLPQYSLPQIGHRMGGRDHSTVVHAIKVTAKRLSSDLPEHVAFAALYHEAEAKARAALIRSAP